LQLEKIDIATAQLDSMVTFYEKIFELKFEQIIDNIGGKEWKLYLAKLGGVKFFLCPNEPSGTTVNQKGVHQFHITVPDLDSFIKRAEKFDCNMEEVQFGEGLRNFCIRDPDGHPWIISDD